MCVIQIFISICTLRSDAYLYKLKIFVFSPINLSRIDNSRKKRVCIDHIFNKTFESDLHNRLCLGFDRNLKRQKRTKVENAENSFQSSRQFENGFRNRLRARWKRARTLKMTRKLFAFYQTAKWMKYLELYFLFMFFFPLLPWMWWQHFSSDESSGCFQYAFTFRAQRNIHDNILLLLHCCYESSGVK